MAKFLITSAFILAVQMAPGTVSAETSAQQLPVNSATITVLGRQSAVVSTSQVHLSDIAEVSSTTISDDEAVVALKKIVVDTSPAPGKRMTLAANNVLDRLTAAGVNVNQIRYLLPRSMDVERAARPVTQSEVERAIRSSLEKDKQDAEIKQIAYDEKALIVPGDASFEAQPFQMEDANKMGFTITAKVPGEQDVRFTVNANVTQWRMVPVASRSIDKGLVVGSDDLAMAKLNVSQLPRDVTHDDKKIIGFEASRPIRAGETFSKAKLIIPPIISAGQKVTVSYKTGLLEATASGIALDSVGEGETVKVKNDSSNKIITGVAIAAGLVGVNP